LKRSKRTAKTVFTDPFIELDSKNKKQCIKEPCSWKDESQFPLSSVHLPRKRESLKVIQNCKEYAIDNPTITILKNRDILINCE